MAVIAKTDRESTCGPLRSGGLERTRYYPRQLVGADDLTQDQRYVQERLRRHNRLLHGWGVVCGACVRLNRQNPCEVIVDTGCVLGPRGDEIVISESVPFDVCKQGVVEQMGCCPETEDPWCAEPRGRCPQGRFFLAIRYAECPSRPVRARGCDCGCDGDGCEYTRIRDSFALKLLTELPEGYTTPMVGLALLSLSSCQGGVAPACPPCPDHAWVILADLVIGPDCRVQEVDCFSHRRNVMTFGSYFFVCTPPVKPGPRIDRGLDHVRVLSAFAGGTHLIDMAMGAAEHAPRAMVSMTRPGGDSVFVPAFFPVDAPMTVGDLVNREGDREFYDPATSRSFTLRELYAHAGVDPDTVVDSTAAALAPLEGKTLDFADLSASRSVLENTLEARGLARLDSELLGAPGRAAELPATTLAAVETGSTLARKLGARTIREIADTKKPNFISAVVKGTAGRTRRELEAKATKAWEDAKRITALRAPGA